MPFDTIRMGASAAGTYEIERSLRFDVHGGNADGAHLQRTFGSAGNRKTWTFSFWAKKTGSGGEQVVFNGGGGGNGNTTIRWDTDDSFHVFEYNSGFTYRLHTNRRFRDPAAWYHIVVTLDTTQGTADNRIKIYVNGVQETSFANRTNPAQDTDYTLNNNIEHTIGNNAVENHNANYFNGYLAEVHFVDGTALAASSFGETDDDTGQWIPKKYVGSHGTNGFYLNFSDNSNTTSGTLGDDDSANTNDWTPNNFSVSAGEGNDSLEDSPTNNWCTWNSLVKSGNAFSDGNLKVTCSNSTPAKIVGTIGVTSGKWYFEEKLTTVTNVTVGVTSNTKSTNYLGIGDSISFWPSAASGFNVFRNASNISSDVSGGSGTGTNWAINDIMGIALDMDNKNVHCYKNGTLAGTVSFSSFGSAWDEVFFGGGNYINNQVYNTNFGQRAFSNLPAGYKALCTANLPEPTIVKPQDHFDVKLYSGNNSTNAISGLNFSPGLVWIACRTDARSRTIVDAVRGFNGSSGRVIQSESTNVEWESDKFNSLDNNGFTVSGSDNYINNSSHTYVAWCWNTPTAFSNDASATSVGTIDSTGKNNATAGFGIHTFVSAVGGTIAHGLGVKPDVQLQKNRDSATIWGVQTDVIDGSWDYMILNEDDDKGDTSEYLTSTTAKNGQGASHDGDDIVSYLFGSVEGFSKISNYTGNGSTNGQFVYTGFKPAFILLKRAVGGDASWVIHDNKRAGYNGDNDYLHADNNQSESDGSSGTIDLLSNGFKLRMTAGTHNGTDDTYFYMAFAERPFKYANAR